MIRARVRHFDRQRGFGFVEPLDGGSDVFLHASVLGYEPDDVVDIEIGALIDLKYELTDRGLRATWAEVVRS